MTIHTTGDIRLRGTAANNDGIQAEFGGATTNVKISNYFRGGPNVPAGTAGVVVAGRNPAGTPIVAAPAGAGKNQKFSYYYGTSLSTAVALNHASFWQKWSRNPAGDQLRDRGTHTEIQAENVYIILPIARPGQPRLRQDIPNFEMNPGDVIHLHLIFQVMSGSNIRGITRWYTGPGPVSAHYAGITATSPSSPAAMPQGTYYATYNPPLGAGMKFGVTYTVDLYIKADPSYPSAAYPGVGYVIAGQIGQKILVNVMPGSTAEVI